MERKETQREMDDKTPLFDENMRMAQKAAMDNQWKEFKRIIIEKKIDMLECFDLFGNTAIHVATSSNKPKLLKELLKMLPKNRRREALRKKNREGNTVLHELIFCTEVEMADDVFKFDESRDEEVQEELKDSTDEEVQEEVSLLEIKNIEGETPLYRAAKYGNLKMLKHLAYYVDKHKLGDIRSHFHSGADNFSALNASVIGQHFDVALWLVRMDKGLAIEKDKKYGFTCLQLLSRMPHVFRSYTRMGPVKNLIYHLLPDGDGETLESFTNGRDLESGQIGDRNIHKSVISKINYGFWKSFAKEFDGIDDIWDDKKKHRLVECLADILVKYDLSWQKSKNDYIMTLKAMPTHRFNVAKRKKQIESKRQENPQENLEEESIKYNFTPLLIAASNGIVEIVEKILDANPAAIFHVSMDGQNILHMAIKHRQTEIFRIIKRKNALNSMVSRITKEGGTILHQVARMDYYEAQELAGVAFQLQDELHWYERVRKTVPRHYYKHCDVDGQTAGDVLDIEHHDMLEKAQKWLKGTAQSCSTVAVLVATVVFAAAYTIPGGSEGGTPVFLRSPIFLFFTVMDIVGLSTSLASVVMFLSILTSPCELWDFHKSIPRKLKFGFAFLFFSLITTMMAFSATILLTIRLELKNWNTTLVYSAALFPVTLFGIIQFPVYDKAKSMVVQLCKQVKKVLPRSCFAPKNEINYIH